MFLTLLLFFFVLILFYKYVTWNYGHWKNLGVPFDPPEFFFGSFKDVFLFKTHNAHLFADIHMKYKDFPYVGYFKIRQPGILVKDPEIIKDVLVKEFNNFMTNDFEINPKNDPIWDSTVFMQTGERWKNNRNSWTASFTTSKIKSLDGNLKEICDVMISYLNNHIEEHPNESLEARNFSSKFFVDSIVKSLFGATINSFSNPDNLYFQVSQSLVGGSFVDQVKLILTTMAPRFSYILGLRIVPERTEGMLRILAREIKNNWEKNGFQKNNLLDSVVLHRKDITETDVAGIIFGFLFVGTDTSATSSSFLQYSLASNIDVQKKLIAEIDEAYEANGGELSYDVIRSLPYLDMVLSESLRMYPALMSIQRVCTGSYLLPPSSPGGEPLRVERGMRVTVPTYGLHRNPENFPEPEKFDPERFNETNKGNIKKYTYFPFSEGPRQCLGMRLAQNQIKVLTVHLLRNFELRLDPKLIGKPIVQDTKSFLAKNVDDVWIRYIKRA